MPSRCRSLSKNNLSFVSLVWCYSPTLTAFFSLQYIFSCRTAANFRNTCYRSLPLERCVGQLFLLRWLINVPLVLLCSNGINEMGHGKWKGPGKMKMCAWEIIHSAFLFFHFFAWRLLMETWDVRPAYVSPARRFCLLRRLKVLLFNIWLLYLFEPHVTELRGMDLLLPYVPV